MSETNSIVILIGGGHKAGKRTISNKLKQEIRKQIDTEIKCIELEDYIIEGTNHFHGPQRYDFEKFRALVTEQQRTSNCNRQVIIITGLYALYDKPLRSLAKMKIFVDCDADTRLNRWIMKDVVNGHYKLKNVLHHYLKQTRPEFNEFIYPTKEFADVILQSENDSLAIELICDGIVPSLRNTGSTSKALYPRFGEKQALNIISENYDGEKNRFYDLS